MNNTKKTHPHLNLDMIILIGYRGSGKSSIGKILAQQFNWQYISSDLKIEEAEKSTVKEIVTLHGWTHFRDIESNMCKKLGQEKKVVLDLGGGAVERSENMAVFKSKKTRNVVIWIDCRVDLLIKRLAAEAHRPFLSKEQGNFENQDFIIRTKEETIKKYQERKPLYEKYSDYHIINELTLADAISIIMRSLSSHHTIN